MKRPVILLAITFFALGAGGCGSPAADKGEETPMPAADGKSDTWWSPTLHGEIRWGEPDQGTFDGKKKFHAWDFTLGEGASAVTLTTAPIDPNVDTVAYLYRRDPARKSWGSYIARNDDHAGEIGSQIAKKLDAGSYRLVVKGYKDKVRGSFTFTGLCEGGGCPAKVAPNDLSTKEEQQLVDSLDLLCGDTYCGGDFKWWTVSVTCAWGTGCTVSFDTQSYYPEDAFSPGWLDRFSADQLTAVGTTTDGTGPYVVTIEKLVDRASAGLWARASCELAVPYAGFDALIDAKMGEPTTAFSDQIMDCVGSTEEILYTIIPSAFAP